MSKMQVLSRSVGTLIQTTLFAIVFRIKSGCAFTMGNRKLACHADGSNANVVMPIVNVCPDEGDEVYCR